MHDSKGASGAGLVQDVSQGSVFVMKLGSGWKMLAYLIMQLIFRHVSHRTHLCIGQSQRRQCRHLQKLSAAMTLF